MRERGDDDGRWSAILGEIGLRPSKALGQHFLHDRNIVRRIAAAAELTSDDLVVEIGPGLGSLTRELAVHAGQVVALELDRRLGDYLAHSGLPANVRVVHGDALKADMADLTGGRRYIVVANLPYSVAAAVIEHVLDSAHRPARLVVMVQREVAERIAAQPPAMSVLAVAVQFYGRPKVLFRIGPGAFVPPPKVDSAVLRIDVAPAPPLDEPLRTRFFQLVRAGFAQRRKRLDNALASAFDRPKAEVDAWLQTAGIAPERRAETLAVDEWVALTRVVGAA